MWVISPMCLMDLAAAGSIASWADPPWGSHTAPGCPQGPVQVTHTEPGPVPPLQLGLGWHFGSCICLQIWHLWCHYLGNHHLICCCWYGYISTTDLASSAPSKVLQLPVKFSHLSNDSLLTTCEILPSLTALSVTFVHLLLFICHIHQVLMSSSSVQLCSVC